MTAAGGGQSGGIASARHPVQSVLVARTKQLQAGALLAAEKQQWRLHQQIQSVEEELAAQLQEVQQQLAHKRVSCCLKQDGLFRAALQVVCLSLLGT